MTSVTVIALHPVIYAP